MPFDGVIEGGGGIDLPSPVQPRITVDDLAEFVEDYSPAGGSLSWEDSAQSIVYQIPSAHLYDAVVLLLGFAYTVPVECDPNSAPDDPKAAPTLSFTGTVATTAAGAPTAVIKDIVTTTPLQVGMALSSSVLSGNPTIAQVYNPTTIVLSATASSTGQGASFNVTNLPKETRYFMRRTMPLQHPLYPWMVCTRIDNWRGVSPAGKASAAFVEPVRARGLAVQKFTSVYKYIQLTASFSQPPYNIYPDRADGFGGNELAGGQGSTPGRYIWREGDPSANMITLDQGTMVYAQGPVAGNPFNAPGYAQSESYQDYLLYWTRIPEDYICNSNGDLVRLDKALNRVNSTPFMGRQPGTLLFQPYKYRRYRMPLSWTDGAPKFWLDVVMTMRYFDPPYGPLNPGEQQTRFGHLTAPAGPNAYYPIVSANMPNAALNGLDRYYGYNFNWFFYPLTARERSA